MRVDGPLDRLVKYVKRVRAPTIGECLRERAGVTFTKTGEGGKGQLARCSPTAARGAVSRQKCGASWSPDDRSVASDSNTRC